MMTDDSTRRDHTQSSTTASPPRETSSWDEAVDQLREWDLEWAETCLKLTTNPWTTGVLPRKTVELISVALNAAPPALNLEGTRRHIRAALAASATREEILMVVKMASMMSIHSCTFASSILLDACTFASPTMLEEPPPSGQGRHATPACDKLRAAGRWNPAWDSFFYLDPVWTDALIAAGLGIDRVMEQKLVELLSIALHASLSHTNAGGTRRHIEAALRAGARIEEIIEVLKLCVVQGVQTCNLVVPILAEELANRAKSAEPTGHE